MKLTIVNLEPIDIQPTDIQSDIQPNIQLISKDEKFTQTENIIQISKIFDYSKISEMNMSAKKPRITIRKKSTI